MTDFFEKLRIRYFLLTYIILTILIILISDLEIFSKSEFLTGYFWEIVFSSLLLIWFIYGIKRHRLDLSFLLSDFKKKVSWKETFSLVGIHFLFIFGFVFLLYVVLYFAKPEWVDPLLNEMPFAADTLKDKIMLFILACILAPIVEEFTFRGVILNRLRKRWGTLVAVIVSSVLFGILHFETAIVGAILFGVLLAVLYLKTNNILVTISVHFFNNLLANLLSFFDTAAEAAENEPALTTTDLVVTGSIGAVMLLLSLIYMVWYLKKFWPKDERNKQSTMQHPPVQPSYLQGTVTGIEGDWAILEVKDYRQVKTSFLPPELKEGDTLVFNGENWVILNREQDSETDSKSNSQLDSE